MVINRSRKSGETPDFHFNNSVVLLQPVEVAGKDGIITHRSEFRSFNIKESLDPFGSKDFEVASLAAIGALGKLQTTYMSPMSSMNVADRFENLNFNPDVSPEA